SLEKSKTEVDDKSLGTLLKYFKKNSELNPQGAKTFQNFLDNRNKFAHQLYFKRASFRFFWKTIGSSWSLVFACWPHCH
ncbi:MAG TPA: hypothetical protein VIJ25_12840, partial [Methylococcales bacterium]